MINEQRIDQASSLLLGCIASYSKGLCRVNSKNEVLVSGTLTAQDKEDVVRMKIIIEYENKIRDAALELNLEVNKLYTYVHNQPFVDNKGSKVQEKKKYVWFCL